MATFMEKYRKFEVNSNDIDVYVEEWHKSESQDQLWEHLGMSRDEYVAYLTSGRLPERQLPTSKGAHEEENELIAEVIMGYRVCQCGHLDKHYQTGDRNYNIAWPRFLNYDKDWGKMMGVVQRVHEIWKTGVGLGPDVEHFSKILSAPVTIEIGELHQHVVEFAKCYRKRKEAKASDV